MLGSKVARANSSNWYVRGSGSDPLQRRGHACGSGGSGGQFTGAGHVVVKARYQLRVDRLLTLCLIGHEQRRNLLDRPTLAYGQDLEVGGSLSSNTTASVTLIGHSKVRCGQTISSASQRPPLRLRTIGWLQASQ